MVMSRDGAQLLDGAESARQRLRDALAVERGSYPFSRDYGSMLGALVDRNVDSAYEARVYAGVADVIAHPPNGLDDIALQEVRLFQAPGLVEVQVFAEWQGEAGERTPIAVRQSIVDLRTGVANQPATGAPGITGIARVGETLTADAGDVADADGLPAIGTWTWQWLRGAAQTAIAGATAQTYDPVALDVGEVLRVRASFTDDAGHAETRTSDPTGAAMAEDFTLASWAPASGTQTLAVMLLRRGADDENWYRHPDNGGPVGALLDGTDALDTRPAVPGAETRITRVRWLPDSSYIRIHNNPDIDNLDLLGFLAGVRLQVQTAAQAESFQYANAGGNFANFNVPATEFAFLDGVAESTEFILGVIANQS